ncbi:helix-turn-helix domain-containing protein [Cellulomonas sp.]|uniref:helix-turn-helix domain-containing protein n=1 Tax=Cellulomonas sp. TaxID=40001 RepID=UPI001B1963F8|nr:helix-turn-helix domain-containing protein [Cellulomonas sp.]MBO9555552.1 helix-turn-helix domain-containing protein [Cellulomonas sp.]
MTRSHSSPALLGVRDVAEMLGIHPETVREMARRKQIRAIKFGGRTSPYRFRPAAVDELIAKREAATNRLAS